MEKAKLICKSCGSDSFLKGEMKDYSNVKPVGKMLTVGSPLLFIFCKDCGEVASIKVKNTSEF